MAAEQEERAPSLAETAAQPKAAAPPTDDAAPPPPSSGDTEFLAEWPFPTEYGDHYETPKRAYRDVKPLLLDVAADLSVKKAKLRLYDPYYCRGKAATALGELGFRKLINRKRDFYADIAAVRDSEIAPYLL